MVQAGVRLPRRGGVTFAEAAIRFRVPEQEVRRTLRVALALGPGQPLVNRGAPRAGGYTSITQAWSSAPPAISGPSRSPSREVA